MRLFLTLCSLATLAYGKPQGYNYGSGVSGNVGQFGGQSNYGSAPSGGSYGSGSSAKFQSSGSQGFNAGFSSGSSGQGAGFGAGGFGAASGSQGFNTGSGSQGFNAGFQSPQLGGNFQQQQQEHGGQFEAPLVHKQFITISAPEDTESLEKTKHLVIGRPQKNYRVVFIKAPSSNSANVKLSAEYAPQDEKTVIYVLTKKDSALEVNDIATPAPTVPSKPEVFFIKYKTEAEAQHAQSQIQAEYDKIEGTSEHTDGGVAPQQSVVGILDNGAGASVGAGQGFGVSGGTSGGFSGSSGSSGFSGLSSGVSSGNFGSSSSNNAKVSTYLPPANH